MSAKNRLILLGLNELDMSLVRRYVDAEPDRYPGFRQLFAMHSIETRAEEKYELLEPWIQWVSIHTGKAYAEHKVFRLGDIVGSGVPQIFEQIEAAGYRVGCISPMNAENRLKRPAYFIPDPWTDTPSDNSWLHRRLAAAVRQAVNENASARITPATAVVLLIAGLRYARPCNYLQYLRLLLGSRRAPWRKALFFDLLLADLHHGLFKATYPQFASLFLNAAAHIQHHYLFNALGVRGQTTVRNPPWYVAPDIDPVGEMLVIYDRILGQVLPPGTAEVLVANGLTQMPYDRIKFYYRLRDHAAFLRRIGLEFAAVRARMARDFVIEFATPDHARKAQERLGTLVCLSDGAPLFGEIERRDNSLSITLTYPNEVTAQTQFQLGDRVHSLQEHVVFVAIKNGMHQSPGQAFFSPGIAALAPQSGRHVRHLYDTLIAFFRQRGPAVNLLPHVMSS